MQNDLFVFSLGLFLLAIFVYAWSCGLILFTTLKNFVNIYKLYSVQYHTSIIGSSLNLNASSFEPNFALKLFGRQQKLPANWSILFFFISRILQGDPKKFLNLLKRGHGHSITFRRNYHHKISIFNGKKKLEGFILDRQLRLNPKLRSVLLDESSFTYTDQQEQQIDVRQDLKELLYSCINKTVLVPANHFGVNGCFNYNVLDEVPTSYTFRIGHNLTFSQKPFNLATHECIPIIPLGINKGQMQYVTEYMSILPPIPTWCLLSIGKDIIRQDEELYNKYAEILLDLIKKGKLKPVVRSLFRENKSLILSEEKIKDFLVEQTQPTILPLTDELVDFARQEEKALGEYLLNELLEFLKDEEV